MKRLKELTDVLLDNENMFALCYTQLTDVGTGTKTDCIRMTDSRNLIRNYSCYFFKKSCH
ncbi:MAG: hypothetical protein ACLUTU_02230 [Blautia faecis]